MPSGLFPDREAPAAAIPFIFTENPMMRETPPVTHQAAGSGATDAENPVRRRIMVDMSATLIHHGHVRLLKKAAALGDVVVALTADAEVLSKKGYRPELSFAQRREVLESIRYVSEVVESPWLITQDFVDAHRCDVLVHGADNSNEIDPDRLVIFPRTEGVSSTELRERVIDAVAAMHARGVRNAATARLGRACIDAVKSAFPLD